MANYLKTRSEVDSEHIGAVGRGEVCISLLHAAVFDTSVKNLVLRELPVSYRSMAINRFYKLGLSKHEGHLHEVDFTWGIAGVLTGYDLPDLLACLAPRKVVLADLKDQMLEPASDSLLKIELDFPKRIFASEQAAGNLNVVANTPLESMVDVIFE